MKHIVCSFALISCFLFVSCANTAEMLRIQYDIVPANSLHLGEVMNVVDGSTLFTEESKPTYNALIASGLKDSDIRDGSFALARIYCCGGPYEKNWAPTLYIPSGLEVKRGDFVEFISGRSPQKGDAGLINTVTRIVQRYDDSSLNCRWDPPNERLWKRVLYCDWMQEAGWIRQGGINGAWFKPASQGKP